MSSQTLADNKTTEAQKLHRAKLLYDSTVQFCNHNDRAAPIGRDQFIQLFYSFIGDTNDSTKRLISSRLARNHNTPRSIAYYLAMDSIEIATPVLLISPVFWETDLLQLIEKLDTPYLCVLARRSNISPAVAQALVNKGSKLTHQVLSNNPTLNLNSLAKSRFVPPAMPVKSSALKIERDRQKLLELTNIGGGARGDRHKTEVEQKKSATENGRIGARLISYVKSNDIASAIGEISRQIGMDAVEVRKIVLHQNASSLAIILKGLGIAPSQASHLLVSINNHAARNIAELTRCMEHFNRFTISQCRDIIRNLGAKLPSDTLDESLPVYRDTTPNKTASARRRQIIMTRAPKIFGNSRMAG